MKRKRKTAPAQDPLLAEQLRQILISGFHTLLKEALATGTLDSYSRKRLAAYLRLRLFRPPSVQDGRAAAVKVFILERFARTGKPVSATAIVRFLREGFVVGGERFVSAQNYNVFRDSVKKYIFPLLHQDTDFVIAGRGPASGWKPRA